MIENGCYCVWLNINGEWKAITLDDWFPCFTENNKPAFTKAKGFELWAMLLEKAYAKAYGCYYAIKGGDPADALRDLTGAPTESMDDEQNVNKLWQFLLNAETRHWIICCYTQSTEVREE